VVCCAQRSSGSADRSWPSSAAYRTLTVPAPLGYHAAMSEQPVLRTYSEPT
jgi:hypothetical protein